MLCQIGLRAAIALALVLAAAPHASGAVEDSEFDVTITARSHAQLDGVERVDASWALLSARLSGSVGSGFPSVEGALRGLVVTRFETEWVNAGTEHRGDGFRPGQPRQETRGYEAATIEYVLARDQAALVLAATSLEGTTSTEPWKILGAAVDPSIGLENARETYGVEAGPNETFGWIEKGLFLAARPSSIVAEARGSVHLYFFQGTMRLQTSDGVAELNSLVWDDPDFGDGRPYVRHAVWYEIWAEDAALEVGALAVQGQTLALFASRLDFYGVDRISLDSAENVNGSLPETSGRVGPSLWIAGKLDMVFELEPRADGSAAYKARARGHASAYAYAGGPAVALATGAAAALGLAAIVLALLYATRDVASDIAGRLFAGLYSKLAPERIATHRSRALVVQVVEANPGISFLELRRLVRRLGGKAGIGTLVHHLAMLERFGLVGSRRVGRFRRYHSRSDLPAAVQSGHHAVLAAGRCTAVARVVAESPGLSLSEIFRRLSPATRISLQGVKYVLSHLHENGLVEAKRLGPRHKYYPRAELVSALGFNGQ